MVVVYLKGEGRWCGVVLGMVVRFVLVRWACMLRMVSR